MGANPAFVYKSTEPHQDFDLMKALTESAFRLFYWGYTIIQFESITKFKKKYALQGPDLKK